MQGQHRARALVPARLALAGAVLVLLALATMTAGGAEAAPGGLLQMNPSNNALDVGDDVTLTVDVVGGANINRVAIAITYNASVVQVVDADAGASGTQVLPGAFPGTDTEGEVTQNSVSSGIINYQYELDAAGEASGNGTVATVQFEAVAEGNANLAFSVRQFADGNGSTHTPSASAAVITVGAAATPTVTATQTAAPSATSTHTPPAATNTTAPASTGTPGPSNTPSATRTVTPTRTPSPVASGTPSAADATPTVRITILQNSNAGTATPRAGAVSANGVNPAQAERANGLPSAGNEGPGIAWWKWTFFLSALLVGFAGWFFTFAVHVGDRDVVLMDKFDVQRRKHAARRLPRR